MSELNINAQNLMNIRAMIEELRAKAEALINKFLRIYYATMK